MLNTDEDAVICDLAETYGILDYRSLPLSLVATLSCGLRDDSRIKMKMNDMKVSTETFLLAQCFDVLNLLLWTKTKDAEKGRNKPQPISEKLLNTQKSDNLQTFSDPEDFMKFREKFMERGD